MKATGMLLTAFDYGVLAVVILSALRGAWRGLVSEVFSLLGWVVAFALGARYADRLAPWVPATWPGGALTQWLVGFAIIVVAVLILASVGSAALGRLTEVTGLRSIDRTLGLLFGLARGVVLVLALYVAAGFTQLPQYPFWQQAVLRPYVARALQAIMPFLPAPLTTYIKV